MGVTGVTDRIVVPCGCLGLYPGPLKDQSVPLTTGLSVSPAPTFRVLLKKKEKINCLFQYLKVFPVGFFLVV